MGAKTLSISARILVNGACMRNRRRVREREGWIEANGWQRSPAVGVHVINTHISFNLLSPLLPTNDLDNVLIMKGYVHVLGNGPHGVE